MSQSVEPYRSNEFTTHMSHNNQLSTALACCNNSNCNNNKAKVRRDNAMVQNKQQKQRKQQNTASITNLMDLFEGTGNQSHLNGSRIAAMYIYYLYNIYILYIIAYTYNHLLKKNKLTINDQ